MEGNGSPTGKRLAMSVRRKQATRPVGLRTAECRRVWVGSAVSHACLVNGMITVYKMNGQRSTAQGLRRSVAAEALPDLLNGDKSTHQPSRAAYIWPPMLGRIFRLSPVGEFVGSGSDTQQLGAGHGPAQVGCKGAAGRTGIWMTLSAPGMSGMAPLTQDSRR